MCNPCLAGNLRYRYRSITGDDLDMDTLIFEVAERFRCFFSDRIGEKHVAKRRDTAGECFSIRYSFGCAEDEETESL